MAMKWYYDESGCFMKQLFVILTAAAAAAVAGDVYVCDYEYQAGWEDGNKWQMRLH